MPDQLKTAALKVHRPSDFMDAIAVAFNRQAQPNPEFVPTGVVRPQRMLVTADMRGIEHSLACALCAMGNAYVHVKSNISFASLAKLRYDLQLAEGLKIVDEHTTFDDPRPRLSESEDLEEVKDSILGVMEGELTQVYLRLTDTLAGYGIHVQPDATEIDPVQQAMSIKAATERPIEQLNAIMSNMKVRRAIKGHVAISVSTGVAPAPVRVRLFSYQDDQLVIAKPDEWDKGTNYNVGDYVRMPGAGGGQYRCVRNFSAQSQHVTGALDKFWKGYEIAGTHTGRLRAVQIAPA